MRIAITPMKKRDLPGYGGLLVEILRARGECVEQKLLKICNKVNSKEVAPIDWQHGVVNHIFKKGERTSWDNYR